MAKQVKPDLGQCIKIRWVPRGNWGDHVRCTKKAVVIDADGACCKIHSEAYQIIKNKRWDNRYKQSTQRAELEADIAALERAMVVVEREHGCYHQTCVSLAWELSAPGGLREQLAALKGEKL